MRDKKFSSITHVVHDHVSGVGEGLAYMTATRGNVCNDSVRIQSSFKKMLPLQMNEEQLASEIQDVLDEAEDHETFLQEARILKEAIAAARRHPRLRSALAHFRAAVAEHRRVEQEFKASRREARAVRDAILRAAREIQKDYPRNVRALLDVQIDVAAGTDRLHTLQIEVAQTRRNLINEYEFIRD